jgi:hypothetical protein
MRISSREWAGHVDSLQILSDALAELEQILTRMAEMTKRTDANWKREFIEMRRQLQLQLLSVGTAADQCAEIKRNPDASAKLRAGWTKMRSTLALHQANWPAVRIDRENAEYLESTRKTRATNWEFVELARHIITDTRRQRSTTKASAWIDPATLPL